jgi:hypothetical protein
MMKYFAGDAVKFRLKLGEIQEGDVLFIEKSFHENILHINGYNRRTYRIPEKRIISKVPKKNRSIQLKNGTSPREHLRPEALLEKS